MSHLEAEVEEQRTHKQMAIVDKEHLRMEVEALRCANVASVGAQIGLKEADSEYTDLCPGETAMRLSLNLCVLVCCFHPIVCMQQGLRQQSFVSLSSKRDMQS